MNLLPPPPSTTPPTIEMVGVVTQPAPLLVSINSGEAARTVQAGVWTPTVGMRVAVVVNAVTRARLRATGPITTP